jgi:chromatin segregation and condensation protein Rec8/ScpA/Scc1 (kleisin family)
VAFTAFFESSVHKSKLVGMFLAVLELVRHQHARASQEGLFEEIWVECGEKPLPSVLAPVGDYEHGSASLAS